MGGSSKKVTVGYKYYIGMHMILCHGPVDKITRIRVDGRDAWVGENSGGGIYINKPSLFGGESREGGVQGTVDFETGGPEQGVNSYLSARLQNLVPSFRGVVGVVLRQVYIGVNPYLKKWAFRVQRIHVRQDGRPQWYDEKAEISSFARDALNEPWEYEVVPYHDNPGYENLTPPGNWQGSARLPFDSSKIWVWPTPPGWPTPGLSICWIKKTIHNVPEGLIVQLRADNGCVMWVNGEYVGASNRDNISITSNSQFPVNFTVPKTGTYEIVGKAFSESTTGTQGGNDLSITLQGVTSGDMNPSHIIRECLTDPDWGMGYSENDTDELSFLNAADTLYNEGFGLSLLWDRQIAIEDFIKEVLKHIDGVLYVDRKSGKFVLKLIRNDYIKDDLIHLNESNIERIDDYGRPAFGELTNSVTVNYWNLSNSNDASVTIQDPALALMQQGVINTTIQYPGCTSPGLASRLAQRDLASLSTPRASCTIYAGRIAKDLNIGSTFLFSWEDYGVQDVVMRVTGIAYGDGRNNRIRIQCTQDTFDMPSTAFITPPATEWEDPQVAPQPMVHQYVFEVPYLELVQRMGQPNIDLVLGASPETGFVGAAGARPSSATINARVYTNPGTVFGDAGLLDFSPFTTLSAGVNKMTTELPVGNIVDEDEIRLGSWAQIGNELVAIIGIDSEEGLLTVKRGVLDSVPLNHSAGTPIIFWDDYLQGDETEYVESDIIDVKIAPVTGSGELDLDDAPVSSVTMGSRAIRPYPPGDFKVNGTYFPEIVDCSLDISVTWASRNRLQQTGGELIGFHDSSITEEPGVTYTVRARVKDNPDFLIYNETGISTLSHTIPANSLTSAPTVVLELASVRAGHESFYSQSHIIDTGISLWTPSNLPVLPEVWLDWESNIVVDSGFVSAWENNKGSLGGSFSQSRSGERPSLINSESEISGRRVVSFDGRDDTLFADSGSIPALFRNVNKAWIFAVYKKRGNDSSPRNRTLFLASGPTGIYRFAILAGGVQADANNRPSAGGRRLDSNGYSGVNASVRRSGVWSIGATVADYSATRLRLFVDGRIDTETNSWLTSGNTSNTNSSQVVIGGQDVADCDIALILSGSSDISNADLDRLHGWAAWQLGLVSLLPSDHPYKESPPTI